MKKYLLILFFPLFLCAEPTPQTTDSSQYFSELNKQLRIAELAMLHLTEDKDYPWDEHHRPYETYDDANNPELSDEQYAEIDRFDYAKSVLLTSVTAVYSIAIADNPNEQIEYMKVIFSEPEDEAERVAIDFSYHNWKLYKDSPEQYLRALWSKAIATDLNQFIY
ncbi:hypothetical protein A1OK_14395 [Enterovibrio norvegicus FF-454]|uniref:Uncharacterized protein n=1 Tax=Enterovibrio norvegicus FF-454 TaxID=1185651 RepID=A0A1E5C165_9GAMM|nr:hypothetical protein [Enterovibrio norvegicus]OEE59229.1 hypothetical protein A1OK_14395 [Enterovibrio norvegicus FF-454]